MTTDYVEIPELSTYYLEDSFVLAIEQAPSELRFRVELVLTESHPLYRPAAPDKQHCYADGWLILSEAARVEWAWRSYQVFTDANGEIDLDNIDYLKRVGDHWLIGGSWGEARVYTSNDPKVLVDE
ncbi:hypothetical protein AB0I60_02640 [Actinosynnema sp. NPDC050436]|uniref:hypothetical protein n=1 Tax=Actinosynnema sp. NPDC050436 TaxID=3155659 RepID=UPI0033ED061C